MLAIPVWRYHKQADWFWDSVSRAIVYFTGMEYVHVGIYYMNRLYESTVWRNSAGKLRTGIRVTEKGDKRVTPPDLCMVPWSFELTKERMDRIGCVLSQYVESDRSYNILKLLVLAIVWPTRWIWKKLKWVPFNHEVFGEVCSGFVDEVMLKSQWDLFPDAWEGYTVPGKFVNIPGWRVDSCSNV